jgi:hypothetical protein
MPAARLVGRTIDASLQPDDAPLTVGRGPYADIDVTDDNAVSAVHAQLVWIAGEWVLDDGGLSRNGSYVNGQQAIARRRLRDGDRLRFGRTDMSYRAAVVDRRVLDALCDPLCRGDVLPATDIAIAAALSTTVARVQERLAECALLLGVGHARSPLERLQLARLALHHSHRGGK